MRRRSFLTTSIAAIGSVGSMNFADFSQKLPFIRIDLTTTNVVKYGNLTFSKRKGSNFVCCSSDFVEHLCFIPLAKGAYSKEEFYRTVLKMKGSHRFFEIINGDLSNLYAEISKNG
jgi:hypothetical protein